LNKQILKTQIEKLARRSQNIITELGGVEQLLDFYKTYKSFLAIPKAGRFTNEELISFCNYLLSESNNESKKQVDEPEKTIDIKKWLTIYENERPLLSSRLNNILNRLEYENNYNIGLDYKVEYFKKFFFYEFDFLAIENLGLKSKMELESLRSKLLKSSGEIEEPQKVDFNKETYQPNNNTFPIFFDFKEREELFVNGQYSFKKMISIFLMFTDKIKKRTYFILKNKFFSESNSDKKIFSKKLNCSIERIRQIEINLIETTIPWAMDRVYNSFDSKPYDLPQGDKKNILILDDFTEFVFRGNSIEPNSDFSKTVYSYILLNSFELLDNFIKSHFRSFKAPNVNLFISKGFIEETRFVKLLDWLDEQIYYFELVGFEYRLEILIKRYFDEHEKYLNENSLRDLHFIIKNIKKDNFELNEKELKRINKKNWIDSLLNEVYLFLKEKNEGQMTNAILDHLNQKNLTIEKEDLLRYLNNHKSTFTSFGMGNWTLVEWKNNNKNLSGSFREIVRNLLAIRTDPIHISELYEYLHTMKKVSLHSITANLKLETEGTFKFFNCSYIGLSDKHYSDYWYRIPKIKPVHMNLKALSNFKANPDDFVNYISSKYDYPKQHINFILDCRKGKYN